MFEVIDARNPRTYDNFKFIELDVLFSGHDDFIPFSATSEDSEGHGVELYKRAKAGEFGEVALLKPPAPTEEQQLARLNEELKRASAIMAPLEDADKLGIISEREKSQLTAWQRYRVALYRMPQSEGWPTDVAWPDAPR